MNRFLQCHASDVIGMLSGFDRLRLRGTLRLIANARGMKSFLSYMDVLMKDFSEYVQGVTAEVRRATEAVATDAGRPLRYLPLPSVDKEQIAREIARQDGIREGLICTLKSVELCASYDVHRNREQRRLDLVPARRKCLHYYHYFIHPVFGFMHARLQSWFPFTLHLCLNGREWLTRQLDAAHIEYRRRENCLVWTEDLAATQRLFAQQLRTAWEPPLTAIAHQVNPAHTQIFTKLPLDYYWSVDQSEWASDVMFTDSRRLDALYPSLVAHGMQHLGSREVMRFLSKRVPKVGIDDSFRGEVVSDLHERWEGVRVKHRVNGNWIKMYNKQGSVLRVETVINEARSLRVYRPAEGEPDGPKSWRYLRKGMADLHRRAELCEQANQRYLDAMAVVEEPTPLGVLTAPLCRRVRYKGKSVRALNPLAVPDAALLAAVNGGEFVISGFRNRDLRPLLYPHPAKPDADTRRRQSAAVTRKLQLLRAHGVIRKVQHSHRYLLTTKGQRIVTALLAARQADISKLAAAA